MDRDTRDLPLLIAFSGLPGVGKTVIARELASQIGAVYLRVDSIEQTLRASHAVTGPINEAGYRVAYAIAVENLRASELWSPIPLTLWS